MNRANLPNNNNDEVEHVPTVSHVGVLVHHQTVSDDLQKGLDCENNEEGILNCFLEVQKKRGKRQIDILSYQNDSTGAELVETAINV